MDREYQTVLTGALLHDIGKFYQKGDCRFFQHIGQHPGISKEFIQYFETLFAPYTDVKMLSELVLKHHENERAFPPEMLTTNASEEYKVFTSLICEADNLSSVERDNPAFQGADFRTRPLYSVFNEISLWDEEKEKTQYAYPLYEFVPPNCFPKEGHATNSIGLNSQMIDLFTSEVEELKKAKCRDFNTVMTTLDSLLLKYLWAVPSSSMDDIPDVSLYDHLKTTTAIAACLYQHHKRNDTMSIRAIKDRKAIKYRMLLADFSGIQNYIFEIASTGEGGIAKRLRARSFHVNILLEVISHFLCDLFELPYANILMSSGGKFYVLLPVFEGSEDILETAIRDITQYLYNQYSGGITINIVHLDFCGKDMEQFDTRVSRLNAELALKKTRRMEEVLIQRDQWSANAFVLYKDLEGKELCRCCRKTLIAHDEKICSGCRQDEELGRKLANGKYLAFNRDGIGFRIFKNYSIQVEKRLEDCFDKPYRLEVLNLFDFDGCYDRPAAVRFMANHVPISENGEIKSFSELADEATGKKYIAAYKADVDNLGFLFMEGLAKDSGENRISVSRITTLSRMLDMFFSGYIHHMLHLTYKNVYSVFSGGDDLFLIGPWDTVCDLSNAIRQDFARYVCNNPHITLSAGITLHKPGYPINRMAEESEDALERAKKEVEKNLFTKLVPIGKNQVCFLDRVIPWERYRLLIQKAKKVEEYLLNAETTGVNRAKLGRLLDYHELQLSYIRDGNISALRWIPMLLYDISRNYRHTVEEFKQWVLSFRQPGFTGNTDLLYLDIICRYAILKTRMEGIKNAGL